MTKIEDQYEGFFQWASELIFWTFICSRDDLDDDLSELKNESVPDDVRKWLASTFAKPEQVN